MSEDNWNLSDEMKKVNWKLTPTLHLDDGKEYGGAVWLYFHTDINEFIRRLKKCLCLNYEDRYCDNCSYCNTINSLAGEKLGK